MMTVKIANPKSCPYYATGRLEITYENVYNQVTKRNETHHFIGTGFLEDPNLLVTAGHCVYGDVTSGGNYQNNVNDPRFADRVRFYPGLNGDLNKPSTAYADALVINIDKEYFQNPNFNNDWAAVELDWDIGYTTGWYGKISNWYEKNHSVVTYGYPGDKSAEMWMAEGKITNLENNVIYNTDLNFVGGQSGSSYQITINNGTYVCGIGTFGSTYTDTGITIHTGGIRISSFIFHYLNSFVTNHNVIYKAVTINPSNYGFADVYPTDDNTKNNFATHYINADFSFRTKRYRTGYIQGEYIVMSPIKTGITEAYIEYEFDIPVYRIEVDLVHWREYSNEWLDKNSGIAELQTWHEKDWWNPFDSNRWIKSLTCYLMKLLYQEIESAQKLIR